MNAPTKTPSLYAISADFAALDDLLDTIEAGATEADADVVATWLATLHATLEAKLCSCIAWARTQEAHAAAAAAEAKRLTELAAKRRARVDRLKATVRTVLEAQGLKRVDTDLGPVAIRGNGGATPVVLAPDLDVAALPPDCRRTPDPVPVKDAIRKRLEQGETIPGASLGDRGKRVDFG